MATKKDLVAELVNKGNTESKGELMKKTNKELEKMMDIFIPEEKVVAVETVEKPQSQSIDMEELKAQMMSEMRAEMETNLRLELEKEMKASVAVEKKAPSRKVKVENDRMIPVMNITAFGLVYASKRTGAEWNWERYGDIEHIEMQELLTMRSSQRKFLDEPWILVMDDEVIDYLGLEKMYDKMIHPDKIENVFAMNNEKFKEVIDNAPRGIAQLIIGKAIEKIEKDELDSRYKVNMLNDKFGTHLGE